MFISFHMLVVGMQNTPKRERRYELIDTELSAELQQQSRQCRCLHISEFLLKSNKSRPHTSWILRQGGNWFCKAVYR